MNKMGFRSTECFDYFGKICKAIVDTDLESKVSLVGIIEGYLHFFCCLCHRFSLLPVETHQIVYNGPPSSKGLQDARG